MLQVARVYLNDIYVGQLRKGQGQYEFQYDQEYLRKDNSVAISLSLPLQVEKFTSKIFFPFFEGLLSEGWLRRVQEKDQKIDRENSFELLVNNGIDLIGAVRVEKYEM